MKGKVLFICGGKWQLPWFNFLKEKGHYMVLVDPGTSPPCLAFADEHIICDARDIDHILQEIEHRNLRFDFITSDQTDVACDTIAQLSGLLNLPANSPEVVGRFTDKVSNRTFLKQANMGHFPAFAEVTTVDELYGFFGESPCNQLILKPADAQSSRGIYILNEANRDQWNGYLEQSLAYSNSKRCIIEEFVLGTEFTIEGLCLNGKHATLAISRKKHFRTGIASELFYPAELQNEKELIAFHNHYVEATGLNSAITHAEYIVDETTGMFWMLECACRGGGTLIPSHIVPWVSGCDVYQRYYNAITGQSNADLALDMDKKAAALFFFEYAAGEVTQISGLENARNVPGVERLELEFKVGDTIHHAADDRGRQGFAIIKAENSELLIEKMNQVRQMVQVKTIDTLQETIQ